MLFYEAIDKNIVSNLPRTNSRDILREEIQELRRYFLFFPPFIKTLLHCMISASTLDSTIPCCMHMNYLVNYQFSHRFNSSFQGRNVRGIWWVTYPSPTLKICLFAGQKRRYNVFLKGNLLDPRPFDQLLLQKIKGHM